MYQLAIIEDKLTCNPDQMLRDPAEVSVLLISNMPNWKDHIVLSLWGNEQVLIEQIEAKYSNKIILNVGLAIIFYDFIEIGDPYLYPGSGCSVQIVKFRLVVFRPFVGEVLVGKVIHSNKEGVKLSLEFFDDIFIPHTHLQNPSSFQSSTNLWIWKYDTDDGAAEFPLTIGEEVIYIQLLLGFEFWFFYL